MADNEITMIDYGGSNLRSAQKAFEFVGATVRITADPGEVRRAHKLVLPGVGAFGAGMDALRHRHLDSAVHEAVAKGTPLLGICLGMQFLFDVSEEMGRHPGLGLIPGTVKRFNFEPPRDEPGFARQDAANRNLKVPHMGWNQIEHNGRHPLLQEVPNSAHAYFVHSYYCAPADVDTIIAKTEYGEEFAAIVGRDRVFGIQFHPEKSQKVGLQIISNYVTMR
jgi:glutamine amidotransferase